MQRIHLQKEILTLNSQPAIINHLPLNQFLVEGFSFKKFQYNKRSYRTQIELEKRENLI